MSAQEENEYGGFSAREKVYIAIYIAMLAGFLTSMLFIIALI
jgi:hypothetical protein